MFAFEAVELVAVGLLVLAAPVLVLAVRRRLLHRLGATVAVSLRHRLDPGGRGWALGVGRFDGDALQWYRLFSLAPRARRQLSRAGLSVLSRREPSKSERLMLPPGSIVLRCGTPEGAVEIAMERSAVTGFLAWLEARPPGAPLPT